MSGDRELGASNERGIFLVFIFHHEIYSVKQDILPAYKNMVLAQNLSFKTQSFILFCQIGFCCLIGFCENGCFFLVYKSGETENCKARSGCGSQYYAFP